MTIFLTGYVDCACINIHEIIFIRTIGDAAHELNSSFLIKDRENHRVRPSAKLCFPQGELQMKLHLIGAAATMPAMCSMVVNAQSSA